jgi:acetate kinase
MGMTPLEGLVMGTRSGDIDPALPFFLADHLGMSFKDIDALLNKESGLKGMCGTNDMREVLEKEASGDPQARAALEVYTYRIRKYLGAYYALLGRLDAVVFTAGIGEHSPPIRERCCRGLAHLGLEIDEERNTRPDNDVRDISAPRGAVRILVVPTNEELKIAEETMKVLVAADPATRARTPHS